MPDFLSGYSVQRVNDVVASGIHNAVVDKRNGFQIAALSKVPDPFGYQAVHVCSVDLFQRAVAVA